MGYVIVFLLVAGFGFGLSCWIYGTILYKSNNLGDSHGDKNDYGIIVTFTSRMDRMSRQERNTYTATHAKRIDNPDYEPKGSELVRRMTKEEIEQYNKTPVPAGTPDQIQAPVNDVESEFRAWEQQQFNKGQ